MNHNSDALVVPAIGAAVDRKRTLPSVATRAQRYDLPDAMKGLAACVIVFHHLSVYTPRVELAESFAPMFMDALYYQARYAVHLFLVIGGFSLAISMPSRVLTFRETMSLGAARYLRLAIPYFVVLTMLMVSVCTFQDASMQPPLVEDWTLSQLVSHLFFMQDVLGYGNVSAGTWYLCIDLQFALLFLCLQWGLGRILQWRGAVSLLPVSMAIVLAPLGIVSAWYWGKIEAAESYVFYFLGSFVLGVLVAWTLQRKISMGVLALYGVSIFLSLWIEFRPRLAVALVTASLLLIGIGAAPRFQAPRWIKWLGSISYSLFLCHFLVNGLVLHLLRGCVGDSPLRSFLSMFVAFACSLIGACLLHYGVEKPANRWISARLRPKGGDYKDQSTSLVFTSAGLWRDGMGGKRDHSLVSERTEGT